jgi:excisionase family DNA binding protein
MAIELIIPEDDLRRIVREELAEAGVASRPFYDKHAAADYLCTSPDGIVKMVERGHLRPVRRRPYYLFSREELDRWALGEAA